MILLIDNYDSFSYNLVQMIGSITTEEIKVVRNDELTIDEIKELAPNYIVLSPGPGKPVDAGICENVIRSFQGKIPILGVCLGHQAICEVFGATISYAKQLMHGKQSEISVNTGIPIFKGLDEKIVVARYHSLVAKRNTIPLILQVIADDETGEVMAVKHREYDIYGLQFHPESVLTKTGKQIIRNFLDII